MKTLLQKKRWIVGSVAAVGISTLMMTTPALAWGPWGGSPWGGSPWGSGYSNPFFGNSGPFSSYGGPFTGNSGPWDMGTMSMNAPHGGPMNFDSGRYGGYGQGYNGYYGGAYGNGYDSEYGQGYQGYPPAYPQYQPRSPYPAYGAAYPEAEPGSQYRQQAPQYAPPVGPYGYGPQYGYGYR